ncbi:MAG: Ig-like domain-containing protein, partial [Candidatus Bathyarchaeia archaeon]
MLTITIILLSLPLPNMKAAISESPSGKIDLFTQKEPYSGKGPNNPSDAFSPQEIVILYAFVTYNEMPVQNLLVAFYVQTPNGASFSFSEKTNSSGIATINFTIPWPCENTSESEVFGEWHVLADTVIGDELFQ